MFNQNRYILRSLVFHRRIHFAVALGVAAATAVLTGALLVGDSVRGSLRDLALDRLGNVEAILVGEHFFRQELADETSGSPEYPKSLAPLQPLVLLRGSAERPDPNTGEVAQRIGGVTLLGLPPAAWSANRAVPTGGGAFEPPPAGEVVFNQKLAEDLGAKVGDLVTLRLPEIGDLPRDSALAKKTDSVQSLARLKVRAVLAMQGWGRFELAPTQTEPRIAFLDLRSLQQRIGQYEGRTKRGFVNGLLATAAEGATPSLEDATDRLAASLKPHAEDYALRIEPVEKFDYLLLSSRRMVLSPELARAATSLKGEPSQAVVTYLANEIRFKEKRIPYSTIAGLDFAATPPLGPFLKSDGTPAAPLALGEVALIDWAADDLGAKVGDEIEVAYFEPESAHGRTVERTRKAKLTQILALSGRAEDPKLTPDFPGITDEADILSWDPPFSPFHREWVRSPGKDEEYWDAHRATPKAYVSLAQGAAWWGSRFGDVTSVRFASPADFAKEKPSKELWAAAAISLGEKIAAEVKPGPAGMAFRPVRAQQLMAASGSTPFDLLFLGFSFFIIIAAVMLVAILFQLGLDQRAKEIGLLAAVGVSWPQIRSWLGREGLIVALLGGIPGVLLGTAYAALMLWALCSPYLWLDAVTAPILSLHVTARSLVLGYVISAGICQLAVWWTLRRLARQAPRSLLAGRSEEAAPAAVQAGVWKWFTAAVALVAGGVLLMPLGWGLSGEAQAGAFFGTGAAVLAGLLCGVSGLLRRRVGGGGLAGRGLLGLSWRSLRRNRSRSTMTLGLVASASFLIIAMSAFRIDPAQFEIEKDSGNGGFAYVAQTDLPLLVDPAGYADPTVQDQLGFTPEEAKTLADTGTAVASLRVQPGDDASCLNLYQTTRPRLLGAPKRFLDSAGFAWAAARPVDPAETAEPWKMLERRLEPVGGVPRVPMVLDDATAQYGLKVGLGGTLRLVGERGEPFDAVLVGTLKNSILQGDVILSEADLLAHYPSRAGYQFFLIQTPPAFRETAVKLLRDRFGEYGFEAEASSNRIARFLAVQNTYLLTFQSLGGLGLLLGVLGLTAIQWRSVLERRGELALMQAVGFPTPRLGAMILLEGLWLLLGGLFLGAFAALFSVAPHLVSGSAALPVGMLAVSIGLVALAGTAASAAAIRAVAATPLLPALRGDS